MAKKFLSFYTLIIFITIISTCFITSCTKKNGFISKSNSDGLNTDEYDLIIYSPHSTDKTEFIIREFRQRTGLKVSLVHEGTGELLERLSNEGSLENTGSSKNTGAKTEPLADVFWGGGIESLEAKKNLFTPYESYENININPDYIDSEHYWTGFSVMTMVIIYNTNLVPPEKIPSNWKDLLDPFFSGRIIMPDPPRSGSAYSILNAMLPSPSSIEDWAFLKKLKTSVGLSGLASSSSLVHQTVASGSYFAGLTSEDAALSIINSGAPISVVYPDSGTIAVPDGVALVKNAPHKENAMLFIDFVLSKDVQTIVSGRWYRRSVRNDVPLPKGAESFDRIKVLHYDVYDAAQKRARILQTWKEL